MFNKVIVANRGAIAGRILRALGEMGIGSVAVYSEADAGAPYLAMADEAYLIGGPRAQESYLNQDVLIDVLRKSGADGVHPGYGFLAENDQFAQRVNTNGARFIGPSPDWIQRMGHKTRARELAKTHGLPVGEGSPILSSNLEEIKAHADRIGYPVLISRP